MLRLWLLGFMLFVSFRVSASDISEFRDACKHLGMAIKYFEAHAIAFDTDVLSAANAFCDLSHKETTVEQFYSKATDLLLSNPLYRVHNYLADELAALRFVYGDADTEPIQYMKYIYDFNQAALKLLSYIAPDTFACQPVTTPQETILVLDVFDPNLLLSQRTSHPLAKIEPIQTFGNPIEMTHGNQVIDLILKNFPNAHIVPITTDTPHSIEALKFIQSHSAQILNMSRAFVSDPEFKRLIGAISKEKIVIKSLGNSATDPMGRPNPYGQMSHTGSLTNYDLPLILDFIRDESAPFLFFAINLSRYTGHLSPSASFPGECKLLQCKSFAAFGEGEYCASTQSFETGSSYSAPQIASLAAKLLAVYKSKHPKADAKLCLTKVVSRLRRLAGFDPMKVRELGSGVIKSSER